MAMKRGYCTNCNKRDEVRRIFEVNSESRFCYCPHCGKKYRPKVAIFNYEKTIAKYNKRAKFFLKNIGQPLYAYNLFAYVLELEPYNKTAKLGRLLSLAYLSTLRRNHFGEVKELLEIARPDLKDAKNKDKYNHFLLSLDKCLNDYIAKVRKKLTIRTYFYDSDCIKLYYKHLRDTISLKRFVAGEFSGVGDKKSSQDVFESIKNLELVYNEILYTADGVDHTFTNFTKYGDPLVSEGRKKIDTKLGKYRMSTLDKDNKKLAILSDSVFSKVYFHMFAIYDKCYWYAGISLGVAIIMMILFITQINQPLFTLFLILFIIFIVQGVAFLALRLIFGSILKKPRY